MSITFEAVLFYGITISEPDYELVETFNESNKHLEITNLSPMDDGNFVLFVRESYHAGDKNEDAKLIKFSTITGKEREWQSLIEDACKALQIEYVVPDWYFATTFS